MNAHRLAAARRANAQGELQGAVACLYSLSAILGPPLMTQVFGHFSSPTARVHFPGAPFLAAARAHRRLRRAVRARTAHAPLPCGGAAAGAP